MQAAARSNLKSVCLELGGKSPLIVFADANLESAAELATTSITYSMSLNCLLLAIFLLIHLPDSGQVCTASSRVYVQKGAADSFKKLLVTRFKSLRLGSPTSKETDLGPQADASQAKAVASYLDIGKQDGTVLTGGEKSQTGSNYIEPTIFAGVPDDSRINVEEVFGPVLVLHEFDTEEEVVARANDTECRSRWILGCQMIADKVCRWLVRLGLQL
jgi:acyl-CoA reductase-like NAD-dependent aldehyde dehydrogenase